MEHSKNNMYDDIIDLPHPESKRHPRMSLENRAAQFSPFAALTGHDAAIKETERITDKKIELDENERAVLDEKLRVLAESVSPSNKIQTYSLEDSPEQSELQLEITVIHFVKDAIKQGGEYVTTTGLLKKIDYYRHALIMSDGMEISMEDIVDIEANVFADLFL